MLSVASFTVKAPILLRASQRLQRCSKSTLPCRASGVHLAVCQTALDTSKCQQPLTSRFVSRLQFGRQLPRGGWRKDHRRHAHGQQNADECQVRHPTPLSLLSVAPDTCEHSPSHSLRSPHAVDVPSSVEYSGLGAKTKAMLTKAAGSWVKIVL